MEASPRLAQLIRQRQDHLLAVWSQRVRARTVAKTLSQSDLIDSIPDLLGHLADAVEKGWETEHQVERVAGQAIEHARQRLGLGYDIGQLVGEYIDLRQALQDVLADIASQVTAGAWNTMNNVIDLAVKEVIERFSRAREHKLHVLDRISSEPLAARNLDARRGADDRMPGVGLGLFIAHAVMAAHGGSIEVRSGSGDGTTFVARMPRERAAATSHRARGDAPG